MYFCVRCEEEHKEEENSIVFSTGYTLINGQSVPLGVCQCIEKEQATQLDFEETQYVD